MSVNNAPVNHRSMRSAPQRHPQRRLQAGIVLPVALILLVIISFAGLLAARNSATYEQFSNNMRTSQVARQAAEDALRLCERIAIDSVENEGAGFPQFNNLIVATELASEEPAVISTGAWNQLANWGNAGANRIVLTLGQGAQVNANVVGRRVNPSCIIQPIADGRFLVTTRGLSNDAVVTAGGALTSGSEIWLQSILTPKLPVFSGS